MKAAVFAALIGMALAAPVRAATPGIEDPEATVVQELVIQAKATGPAWWTVQRGGAVVHILGLPDEPLPKGLRWDQAALQRKLTGASVLIMPVEARAGLLDIPALLRMRSRLKSHAPMEQGLPEPLQARFAAARTRLGKPAPRYAGWDPIVAGMILSGDFHDAAKVSPREPLGAIRGAASRLGVPVRPAAKLRAVALFDPAVRGLTPAISQGCLAEALDEVDAGAGALNAAGGAWARGDVQGVLAGPRGASACLLLINGGASIWRQAMADFADAVAGALQKPGHAVAVLPIRALIARDGVLERLKARGFEVSGGGI